MIRIAMRSIRHPRIAIAIWVALAAGLGLLGSQIESKFVPSILVPKGTQSAKAEKLAQSRFGDSQLTPIMLVGPAAQLDKQGPQLVAKLRTRTDTQVLSPWDGTPGSDVLRPRKTAATIVASIAKPEKDVISTVLPEIRSAVDKTVSGPVTAHITGQASIDQAIRDKSLSQTKTAVAVAIPAVFLVLLLLLRAPIAALLVTGFAASLLPVGYGLTTIAASVIRVDAVAAAGAAMVGLALGVGFGLLMVARFRDDLRKEASDPEAAAHGAVEASRSAGRAVLIAGTAMVAAMVIATTLSMTEILNSIGIGATLMAVVAAAGAVGVLPAVLKLTGGRIEAGVFGASFAARQRERLGQHKRFAALPAAAAGAAMVLVIALSVPVLSLNSGPPDAKLLPSSSQARQDYEAVAKVMGPGWLSPFEVVVARNGAPVTTRQFLAKVNAFEKKTAKDKAVTSVLGPGALLGNANELQGVPKGLDTAAATAKSSKKDLKKLIAGLQLATNGVSQLRGGLGAAASGAGQLHGGTGQAYSGSGQLKSGLDQANAGAQQLKDGAAQAAAGARDLASGLSLAKSGVAGGLPAINKLITAVNANANQVAGLSTRAKAPRSQVATAAQELAAMTVGKNDPRYNAVVSALQKAAASDAGLATAIDSAATQAQLNATTVVVVKQQVQDLQAGISKLLAGGNQLSAGLKQLSGGNSDLASGIAQLDAGGAQLQNGLAQLYNGAGQLAAGLGSGIGPSGQLLAGMHTITSSVVKARAGIPSTKDLEKLKKQSPGLFNSGYFVLAALDGAPRASRDAAQFVVNVERGGTAGRITVVPKQGATAAATRALHDRLVESAAAFAKANHAQVAVGGTGSDLVDYRNMGLERLPVVVLALALLTFAMLALVTRSVLVPAAAVVLNLLTATAAFGVLTLLFGGDSPVLGGPGFVDPVTMIAVVTVVLALAIEYEVFALERLRRVSTAGIAMLAVLLPFAPADLVLVRQFAIGMAVAVAIDALVVRRILLRVQGRTQGRPPIRWHLPHVRIHLPHHLPLHRT